MRLLTPVVIATVVVENSGCGMKVCLEPETVLVVQCQRPRCKYTTNFVRETEDCYWWLINQLLWHIDRTTREVKRSRMCSESCGTGERVNITCCCRLIEKNLREDWQNFWCKKKLFIEIGHATVEWLLWPDLSKLTTD